eukprot:CAMPEP_0174850060 /NCGR_PEP_ID=MMETSP1114-20130205/18872_1 /TAXON_ID=312471 /ORGANISM="Neobodo designis, Strain CCAP 1951/1" /LENGTH=259 /DNA_ID=CAMNT_0016084487 /DNA_START=41 /DNA_END=820 /DNA_ORIENTATION=+
MGGGGVPKAAHPTHREWYWEKDDPMTVFKGLDWPAVRRGRQVYTEVFAPCHALSNFTFNHFQGFMTREEIKELAAQYDVVDARPQPDGTPEERKGKGTDYLPAPYPNQEAAAFANNGAAPPDLRWILRGREGGADYVFALLTGYKWSEYMEVPPYVTVKPGQFWNPYFKGGVLAMPPPLSDGLVEYTDGTPATTSQMAKDVVAFLKWSLEPDYDQRRVMYWKAVSTVGLLAVLTAHVTQWNGAYNWMQRATFRYHRKPW